MNRNPELYCLTPPIFFACFVQKLEDRVLLVFLIFRLVFSKRGVQSATVVVESMDGGIAIRSAISQKLGGIRSMV
jgi:hypothetical protein